eukprot:4163262-Prymnesium_polylepis.2
MAGPEVPANPGGGVVSRQCLTRPALAPERWACHNVANPVRGIWANCVTALFGLSRVLRTAL